jgi:signal transduction histidine kinase
MQQGYARSAGLVEVLPVADLIGDALQMHVDSFNRHGIEIVRRFAPVPPVRVDKHKALQILVNLLGNARQAMDASSRERKRLIVTTGLAANGQVRIVVEDNGVGITRENLTRIFQHGFTTKPDGHGFGLHTSALSAREMGGSLSAASDGPDCGAVFTLELPIGDAIPGPPPSGNGDTSSS